MVMDFVENLFCFLDDGHFIQIEKHSVDNDGIGDYEFQGIKSHDSGTNYLVGNIKLVIESKELADEFEGLRSSYEYFLDECILEEEIDHIYEYCKFYGEDISVSSVDIYSVGIELIIEIDYTSSLVGENVI